MPKFKSWPELRPKHHPSAVLPPVVHLYSVLAAWGEVAPVCQLPSIWAFTPRRGWVWNGRKLPGRAAGFCHWCKTEQRQFVAVDNERLVASAPREQPTVWRRRGLSRGHSMLVRNEEIIVWAKGETLQWLSSALQCKMMLFSVRNRSACRWVACRLCLSVPQSSAVVGLTASVRFSSLILSYRTSLPGLFK